MVDEVTRLYSYAYEVCEGSTDVCHEVKLACQRSISDLKASADPDFPYYFDPKDGIKFERFAARFRHLEGELAGEPFILMPWQLWAFAQILGWRHKVTGHRRFKTAHIEVPRGNGKSFMASVYAIYALSCDGVQGPQVYSAATSQRQARIVFDVARDLCANEPKKFIQGFLGLEIRAHDIQLRKRKDGFTNRGIFRPLCADGNRLDGLNISCAIVDELHAIKKRLVWDKLITGAGKRPSTLVIAITTAGMSLESIGYDQNSYCRKVLNGDIDAPAFWGCIWKADASDDPYCVETLRKANPCWDAHQDHEQVLATMEKARLVPAERAGYLTLHLNQWLANGDSWLDLNRLVRCRDTLNIEDFKDLPCYVGIDMAKVTDMAAVVQCFYRADKLYVFPHYFLPSETIANSNNSQYHHWQQEGYLHSIPGPIIDPGYVLNFLEGMCAEYDIVTLNADPALMDGVAMPLAQDGQPIAWVPQAWKLSKAAKALQSLVLQERIRYESPVWEWNARNARVVTDRNENIYVCKDVVNSTNLIDGVVSCIFALHSLVPSLYEGSGTWYIPD